MPLMLLPFFGSGFVPTDSMPDPLRWFADNQPFTPDHRDTSWLPARNADRRQRPDRRRLVRRISVLGYVWARNLYERDPAR
jgi:ABC-2 type transport system permease protein